VNGFENRVTTSPWKERRPLWLTTGCVLLSLAVLRWGGYLLVSNDRLPAHADVAVVLQGSLVSEDVRIAGAVRLLQQNIVDKILLSIPETGYWGQSLPGLARAYLQKQYGNEISDRFEFCETGPSVDSTEQEARAIISCIQKHQWQSVVIVTSNFHSRRAGMIWRRTSKQVKARIEIRVDGVADPSFSPNGWWRHRRYAKTWFLESMKLANSVFP
jgi:uncharacterized SAM-binding protein YcdF (DUF218 family)